MRCVGALPWSPLAGGFLIDKYSGGEKPESGRAATDDYTARRFTDENWAVLDGIRDIADIRRARRPAGELGSCTRPSVRR